MKFPKSLHADGWSEHIDTTPGELSTQSHKLDINAPLSDPQPHVPASAPLHAAKAPPTGMRMNPPSVRPAVIAAPAIDTQPTPRAATLPPQRDDKLSWMIGAGAGAAVIAAIAVWAVNRPADVPTTPPALVTGSAEPQAEVAAATPAPEVTAATAAADTTTTTTTASADSTSPTTTAAAEPARLGPPITTVKPAAEARPVAQAAAPAPRPDLVVRANPRDVAPVVPERAPYLQPSAPVVAAAPAPTTEVQPLAVTPGTAPINLPPTAAGPVAATTTPPVVTAQPTTPMPDPTVTSTSPGTPPLAQAPLPVPEDSGITVKVRSALAADSTLAAVPISVSTDHGVVKLEGQAPDAPTRERATVVASSASGVKAVDNRLTLPPSTVVSQAIIN